MPPDVLSGSGVLDATHLDLYGILESVIAIFAFNSHLRVFSFLYKYFYSTYFSVIVLKLAVKYLQKRQNNPDYVCLNRLMIIAFSTYEVALLTCLLYTSIRSPNGCYELPYLIINSVSLAAALFFAMLGLKHSLFE